jgi:hypothetical protein
LDVASGLVEGIEIDPDFPGLSLSDSEAKMNAKIQEKRQLMDPFGGKISKIRL